MVEKINESKNIPLKKRNIHVFLLPVTKKKKKKKGAPYSYLEKIIKIFCNFCFSTTNKIVIDLVKSIFHDDYSK